MLSELYDIARAEQGGQARELLPLERMTVPSQKRSQRKRASKYSTASSSIELPGISSSQTSNIGTQDSWFEHNTHGPNSFMSIEEETMYRQQQERLEQQQQEQAAKEQEEKEEQGERLLAAINRMEKYLTRDIMLQELMSKDNVASAAQPITNLTTTLPTTDNDKAGSTTTFSTNKTWLEKEKERLILLSSTNTNRHKNNQNNQNNNSTTTLLSFSSSSSSSSNTSTLPTSILSSVPSSNYANSSSSSTDHMPHMSHMSHSHLSTQLYENDVTSALGLPLFPTKHKSTRAKPTLIGSSEVNLKNLPRVNKTKYSTTNNNGVNHNGGGRTKIDQGTLPDSFDMPGGMVSAVSNVVPFRNQLQKHGLARGDWVRESEQLMTEERKASIQLASSNVQPPFWNPNDTTTVVQYGRGGQPEARCVAKYDYQYEDEHAALVIQATLRGHMARLDIFKPWGARDRWMAVKIQRFYRMCMARKEYHLLRSVRGIQGTYRDPFCRLVQRVWRGLVGRRRFLAEKTHVYPPLVLLQTQWRMYVARERVKFRKAIRDKWQARHIQRVFRGHWGRQRCRQQR